MNLIISLNHNFLRKEVHVLPRAIILSSRAMAIDVIVFVFGSMWVVGWYLEWALLGPPIGSLVCVIWICVSPWTVP